MNQQPNILFIMADDHGANAIGAYGSRMNQTPHLDRIANEGARLDRCYVTNSICSPSRAAILTGTHNHLNRVTTLFPHLDNRLPHVAKHLQHGGYQTAMVGKWHLGTGTKHCPTGFDFWSVLPGQGHYVDPEFQERGGSVTERGYVTDLITDKCLDWLERRDKERPFFLMCHHKAPHREWDPKPEHRSLYPDPIPVPETFEDDYANRGRAAAAARMRISEDLNFLDLDLVVPAELRGSRQGERTPVPFPPDEKLADFGLHCALTGEWHTFKTQAELKAFKYQRYMRKYLQTVHSVDENVGRLLDYLEQSDLARETVVIYTSDQGFYLGEHGWFDKRFIYEESFRMPFLIRYPAEIKAGTVNTDMTSNVDFAPLFLDYAGLTIPNYMQGRSFRENLQGRTPDDWTDVAYQRYWMNADSTHNVYAHYGIRDERFKLIYWYNEALGEDGANSCEDPPEWELFDLEKDPLELVNVYHQPEYAVAVTSMRTKLDREMARIGDIPRHRSA